MDKDILLDGKTLISAKRASEKFGYSQDYIGQLARSGQIDAKLIGRTWFVEDEALQKHKKIKSSRKKEIELPVEPISESASQTGLPKKYESEPVALLPELTKRPQLQHWSLRNKVIAEAVLGFSMLAVVSASGIYGLKNVSPTLAESILNGLSDIGAVEQRFATRALSAGNSALSLEPVDVFFEHLAGLFKTKETEVASEPATAPLSTSATEAPTQIVREVETIRETRVVERGTAYYEDPAMRAEVAELKNLFASRSFLNLQTNAIYDSMSQSIENIDHLDSLSLGTTLDVLGLATFADLAFENAVGTSATTTNLFSTNAVFTNLIGGSQTLTDLLFTNATGTSATTTSLFSSHLATDDLRFISGTGTNLEITNSTATNATTTNLFATTASSTNLFASLLTVGGRSLIVDSSQNVGIGVAPSYRLDINGSAVSAANNSDVMRIGQSADGGVNIILANNVGNLATITGGVTSAGAGTDDGVLSFGTATNGAVSERMRITSSGNVGIGTTTPSEKLVVDGGIVTAGFRTGSTGASGVFDYFSGVTRLLSQGPDDSTRGGMSFTIREADFGNSLVPLEIKNTGDVLLAQTSGNVGIGTTTPLSALSIAGTDVFARVSGSTRAGLIIQPTTGGSAFKGWQVETSADMGNAPGGYFTIVESGASSRFTIASSTGNVGIGTTNPREKLEVSGGNIHLLNTAADGVANSLIGYIGGSARATANDGDLARIEFRSSPDFYYQGEIAFLTAPDMTTNSIAEKMRLDVNGNLGIGTTNPTSGLTIAKGTFGAPATSGSAANGFLRINDSLTTAVALDAGLNVSGTAFAWIQARDYNNYANNYSLSLNPNGGNVGIGTTNPGQLLDIGKSATDGTTQSALIRTTARTSGGGIRSWDFGASSDTLGFQIKDTEMSAPALSISLTTGNVGIGTTTPDSLLHVYGNSLKLQGSAPIITIDSTGSGQDRTLYFRDAFGGGKARIVTSGSTLYFGANGFSSEQMVLLSSGNVGIGTTNPGASLHVAAENNNNDGTIKLGARGWLQHRDAGTTITSLINDYNDNSARIDFRMKGTAEANAVMTILGSGSVGIGTTTPPARLTVQTGTANSQSIAQFYTTGSSLRAAVVTGSADDGILDLYNSSGSRTIEFHSGGLSYINTGGGNFAVGTDVELLSSKLSVAQTAGNIGLTVQNADGAKETLDLWNEISGDATLVKFRTNGATLRGSITYSSGGGVTVYNTTSDVRLKNDLGVLADTSVLSNVKIHKFTWKETGNETIGVFAQELYNVLPNAVTVGTDEVDSNGKLANPWQVDYSKLVPDLVLGWQVHESMLASTTITLATLTSAFDSQGLQIDQMQADIVGLMSVASTTTSILSSQDVRLSTLESLMASSAFAISTSTPGFLASVIDAVESTIFALLRSREVHTDKLCVEDVCVTREKFLEIVSGGPSATDDASDEEEADEEPEGAETIDESVPEEPAETATSTEDVVDNGADSTATSTPVVEESDMPDEEPAEEPSSEELTEEPPAPQEVQQPDSEPVPTEPAQEPAS